MKEAAIALVVPPSWRCFNASGCWRLIPVLLFLFFIPMPFPMKSLSCKAAWLKTFSSSRFLFSSLWRPPRLRGPTTGRSCSLWHSTSCGKKGRVPLAVGRSHHSPMTRLLWCPPPSPMACQSPHSGKSISRVWRERGHVCWQGSDIHPEFGTRGLQFIIALHAVPHAIRQWSTRTSFVCVCGGGTLPVFYSFMFAGPVCFALRVCEHAATEWGICSVPKSVIAFRCAAP